MDDAPSSTAKRDGLFALHQSLAARTGYDDFVNLVSADRRYGFDAALPKPVAFFVTKSEIRRMVRSSLDANVSTLFPYMLWFVCIRGNANPQCHTPALAHRSRADHAAQNPIHRKARSAQQLDCRRHLDRRPRCSWSLAHSEWNSQACESKLVRSNRGPVD